MRPPRPRLASLVPLLALAAPTPAQQSSPPPVAQPGAQVPEQNPLDPLEGVAREAQAAARSILLEPLAALALDDFAARLAPGFEGRFPGAAEFLPVASPGGEVAIEAADGASLPALDAAGFEDALRAAVSGWEVVERAGLDLSRFLPAEDGSGALALARFTLGGRNADGRRTELHGTLELNLAFTPEPRAWTLVGVHWHAGHRASRAEPRFVDVSDPTGFHLNLSPSSQRLLRELVDDRALWALGGVSSLDWNADGLPDLLATRRDQIACLFVNDGRDGFRRAALPIETARGLGACFLFVDLDDDGLEELVPGQPTGQSGRTAWLGVYTRRNGEWVHLPRALEFEMDGRTREPFVQTIVPADVDGDGQLDLFVGVESNSGSSGGFSTPLRALDGGRDLVFINRGGLTFTEEGRERGLGATQYTTAACFNDWDHDEDLDLLVATTWGPDWLLENDGSGQFSPRLDVPLSGYASIAGGVALDTLDGAPAVYVTNPYSPAGTRVAAAMPAPPDDELKPQVISLAGGSRLFLLDEESGEWRERSAERGAADAGFGFGPVLLDLDDDGDRDLFVANGVATHEDASLLDFERLQWRQVVADALNLRLGRNRVLADPEALANFRGSHAGGQRERAFVRAGGELERFYEAGYVLGLDLLQDGRSAVALDFDGDGDQDLATFDLLGVRLLENRGTGGHFARVSLEGGAAAAIGARIELEAGGRLQRRVVSLTSGHSSQVLLEQHFGLGAAESIDRVRVAWASGGSDEWEGLPVDRRIVLSRGEAEPRIEELSRWPAPVRRRPLVDMTTRLQRLSGKEGSLATTGRPAVIGCWSPKETESLRLLATLAALDEEHAGRIRVAGLCVGATDPAAADALAKEQGARFNQFAATPELLAAWFGEDHEPEIPTTFVFDAAGELRRVVVGVVDMATVGLAIDSLLDDDVFVEDLVRKAEWQILQGDGPGALDSLRNALRGDQRDAGALEALGKLYVFVNDLEKAEEWFGRAVTIDPDLAEAQYNLGTARINLGQITSAIEAFEAAWRVRGDHLETLVALGSAYAAGGRVSDALEAFERAREMAPEDGTVWYLCGRALADLGRIEKAREAFGKALELQPELEPAKLALEELGG